MSLRRSARGLALAASLGVLAWAAACRSGGTSTPTPAAESPPVEPATPEAAPTLPPQLADLEARLLGAWPAPVELTFRDDETLAVSFSDGVRRRWRAADGWSDDTSDDAPHRPPPTLPTAFRWCGIKECPPDAKPASVKSSAVSGDTALIDRGVAVILWDLREARALAGIVLPDGPRELLLGETSAALLGPRWLGLWNLRRREVAAVRTIAQTRASALSRDGSTLALAADTLLEIWDPVAFRRLAVAALPGPPRRVAVSPSGARIAVAGDRWLRILDRDAAPIGWVGLAVRRFEAIAFDARSGWLAGVDAAGMIDLVDPRGGAARRFAEAPEPSDVRDGARYIDFSPDGRRLLNGGPGSRVAVWDRASGRMLLRALNLAGTSPSDRAIFAPPHHLLVERHDMMLGCILWDLQSGGLELASWSRCDALRSDTPVHTRPAGGTPNVDLFAGAARVRFGDDDELLVVPLETVDGPDHLIVDRLGTPRFIPPSAVPPGVSLPEAVTTRGPWRDLRTTQESLPDIIAHPSAPPQTPEESTQAPLSIDVLAPQLEVRRTVHGCTPVLGGDPQPLFGGHTADLRLPQGVSLYPQGAAHLAAPAQMTPGCGATLRRFTVTVVPDAPLSTLLDQLAPKSVFVRRELVERGPVLEALVSVPWTFTPPGSPPAYVIPRLEDLSRPETYGPHAAPASMLWIRMMRANQQVWLTVAETSIADWPFLAPAIQASFRSLRVHHALPGPFPPVSALERFSWPWEPESALVTDWHVVFSPLVVLEVILRADGRISWSREHDGKIQHRMDEPSLQYVAELLEALEAVPVWRPADEGQRRGIDDLFIDLGGIVPPRPHWELDWDPPAKPEVTDSIHALLRELWKCTTC